MKNQISLLFLIFLYSSNVLASECVVLLHGLAKSERDMRKMDMSLQSSGYKTVNFDYQSRKSQIPDLAKSVLPKAIEKCGRFDKVHFVTHSMGGILVRQYLGENELPKLGRVVMMGPPNQGSEVVDFYSDFAAFTVIGGPAGLQLGTGRFSLPKHIGKADFEVGIIAGTRSINLILSSILPGKDDGKVTVESTKLKGMADHIAMPVTHPFMMKNKKVIQQVIYFLENGKFNKLKDS